MMNDEANHLAAILARPGDDLMRTAYADFLEGTAGVLLCRVCEGHGYDRLVGKRECPTCYGTGEVSTGGGERAEFIRVQCELATLAAPDVDDIDLKLAPKELADRIAALRRRERELLSLDNKWNWSGGVGDLIVEVCGGWDTGTRVEYHRGFVEVVKLSWPDFRTHADAIRSATPLRKVRLTTWPVGRNGPEPEYPGIRFELPDRAAIWELR